MDPEKFFSWCGLLAMVGWLSLIILPRWKWTARLIASAIIPAILGVVYSVLIITQMPKSDGGFGSLADVATFFENPYLLLAGWIHYLAFDLAIGAWEVRDAQRIGIHHLVVIPCLIGTFMLGPAGLLLYLILRGVVKKQVLIGEPHVAATTAA